MKAEITNKIEVILTLSEEEALWLKAVVQNPVGCIDEIDESANEKLLRDAFWSALDPLI